MRKHFLALLALVALLTACTVDAGEGLLEMNFNQEDPLSDSIYVDVARDVSEIEFIVEAQFNEGSATIFVHEPGGGTTHTLALGITDSTQVLTIDDPSPGRWLLEVHVDGNSEIVVDGKVRLAVRKNE